MGEELGKKSKIEIRKEILKEKLLNDAEVIFKIKGIKEATMEDIANEAVYSKAALYQHFSSKEEIQALICLRALKLLLTLFNENTNKHINSIDKVKELGSQHFYFMSQNEFYHEMLNIIPTFNFEDEKLRPTLLEIIKVDQDIELLMVSIISVGQNNKELTNEINADVLANLLKGMSEGVYKSIKNKCINRQIDINNEGKEFYKQFQNFISKSLEFKF